jgi:type IV pilus assembly protein PilM
MMRDTVSGTNQIIQEISREFDVTLDEAEQTVNGLGNDIVSQDNIQEICKNVSLSWCSEICEVVNTFQTSANDEKIEKIVLSGGGALIKGFKDSLSSELDADISIMNPFESLIINEKKFTDSFITKAIPLAPIAIGLALRSIDDK